MKPKSSYENRKKASIRQILWISLGIIATVTGAIGIVLPVLPTTPFLMVASFAFAKGSDRFHNWFVSTKLYKNHLDDFVKNREMTLKTKLSILLPASLMLIFAILMMPSIYGRIFLVFLIIFKYTYFFTKIKTIPSR